MSACGPVEGGGEWGWSEGEGGVELRVWVESVRGAPTTEERGERQHLRR